MNKEKVLDWVATVGQWTGITLVLVAVLGFAGVMLYHAFVTLNPVALGFIGSGVVFVWVVWSVDRVRRRNLGFDGKVRDW